MSRAQDRELVTIAHRQRGLLLPQDLTSVTGRPDEWRRRLRSGLWQQVLPRVLAAATADVTDELRASAAMLWEPRALLSHHEAAAREGIWVPDRERLRVTVPFSSKKRSLAELEVIRSRVMPSTFQTDGFHRWTPAPRTVVDLAMVLTRKQLEAVLLSAVRHHKATAAEVEATADQLSGRAGLGDLRRVTALWSPERESFLEDLLFEDVRSQCHEAVTRQAQVRDRSGQLNRIDVAVVSLRLAFEADGLAFHSTDQQIAADHRRDRRLMVLGWLTVRFREDALADRRAAREEVRALIDRRRRDLRAA